MDKGKPFEPTPEKPGPVSGSTHPSLSFGSQPCRGQDGEATSEEDILTSGDVTGQQPQFAHARGGPVPAGTHAQSINPSDKDRRMVPQNTQVVLAKLLDSSSRLLGFHVGPLKAETT